MRRKSLVRRDLIEHDVSFANYAILSLTKLGTSYPTYCVLHAELGQEKHFLGAKLHTCYLLLYIERVCIYI